MQCRGEVHSVRVPSRILQVLCENEKKYKNKCSAETFPESRLSGGVAHSGANNEVVCMNIIDNASEKGTESDQRGADCFALRESRRPNSLTRVMVRPW